MKRYFLIFVLLLSLCWGLADAAPPPGGTVVTLSVARVQAIGSRAQAEAWLAGKGYTVQDIKRGSRQWVITLNETLDAGDKVTLHDDIVAATDGVTVQ